jgi:predicted signal transduction protein with EAL and GGDEF domain
MVAPSDQILPLVAAAAAVDAKQWLRIIFPTGVEASSELLVGFEALLRLRGGNLAHISPAVSVTVAEQMGFIAKIGTWVLKEACRVAADWPTKLKVAVNTYINVLDVHDRNRGRFCGKGGVKGLKM